MLKSLAYKPYWAFLLFTFLLAVSYWPGTNGDFIFDDYYNLKTLGAFGPVDNWQAFLLYITSGNADPTGRPVSMLSFLWDATNWPAAAEQFKKTNILIHLLNAALLFRVLQIVESKLGNTSERGSATAALGAALWAAHPFFVSTTLYVVQRHAMLPLTFTLLAWLCWAQTEKWLDTSQIRKAWLMAIFGVCGITVLAGFSKANGFLAPLLILVTFGILNTKRLVTGQEQKLKTLILIIPTIAISLYLLLQLKSGLDVSYGRDFTLGERLLTQPRVLFTYLAELYLPGSTNSGFYTGDTIVVSKNLFQPFETILYILLLFSLSIFAFKYKKQFPRIALAIAWFFAGHLVESSSIMLEMYFEHRNYMPSVFLFLPVSYWLINTHILLFVRRSVVILLPALLLFITFNKAVIWGAPELQARIWDAKDPGSFRNAINAASTINDKSTMLAVVDKIKVLQKSNPDSINLALGLIGSECQLNGSSDASWALAYNAARTDNEFNSGIFEWLIEGVNVSIKGNCTNMSAVKLSRLLDSFSENKTLKNKGTTPILILYLKGYFSALNGNPDNALIYFNEIIKINQAPYYVLNQAAFLGNLNREDLALAHIKLYRLLPKQKVPFKLSMPAIHRLALENTGYFENELDILERNLQAQNKHSLAR